MQSTINPVVNATLLAAAATPLATATPKNIPVVTPTGVSQPVANAIFLNAGTWLLTGNINFVSVNTTAPTIFSGGFNTTTGTLPAADAGLTTLSLAFATTGETNVMPLTNIIVNVGAQGANYFLVGQASFITSTLTAYGSITAVQLTP